MNSKSSWFVAKKSLRSRSKVALKTALGMSFFLLVLGKNVAALASDSLGP
jgi:hypothetical protein